MDTSRLRAKLSFLLVLTVGVMGVFVPITAPKVQAATTRPNFTLGICALTVDRTGGNTNITGSASNLTGWVTVEYPDHMIAGQAATFSLAYPRISQPKSALQAIRALGLADNAVVKIDLRNFKLESGSDDVRIEVDPQHRVDLGKSTVYSDGSNKYNFSLGSGFTFNAIADRAGTVAIPVTNLQFEMWAATEDQSKHARVGIVNCPLTTSTGLATLTVAERPEIKTLQDELAEARRQLSEKIAEGQQQQQQLNATIAELEEKERQLQQSQSDNSNNQQRIEQLNRDIATKDAQVRELEARLQQLTDQSAELAQTQTDLAAVTAEKQRLEAEKQQLELENADLSAENSELRTARTNLEATRDELQNAVAEWRRKYEEYPQLEAELAALRADAANHADQLAQADADVAAAKELAAKAEAMLAQVAQVQAEADAKVAKAESEKQEAEAKLQEANERAAKAEAERAEAEKQAKDSQAQQRQTTNQLHAALLTLFGVLAAVFGLLANSNILQLFFGGQLRITGLDPQELGS